MTHKIQFDCCFFNKHSSNHPGVKFINILLAAFALEDSKSAKRLPNHQCLLGLFGSAHIKAARKMLVKSTPVFCSQIIPSLDF